MVKLYLKKWHCDGTLGLRPSNAKRIANLIQLLSLHSGRPLPLDPSPESKGGHKARSQEKQGAWLGNVRSRQWAR